MGEYFSWVNVDKKEYLSPSDFGLGSKFHESIHKENSLLRALHELLTSRWRGDSIVFLGDEGTIPPGTTFHVLQKLDEQARSGDHFDHICENYRNVSCLFKDAEAEVRGEISNYLEALKSGCPYVSVNEYCIDLSAPFDGLFLRSGKVFRYILDHTKKVYYSLGVTKILYEDGSPCDYADPLSVLMAYGRSVDPGAWLGDVIGVSDSPPSGYVLLTQIYLENGGRCVVAPENGRKLNMRKIDLFWQSDPDWWEFRDGDPVLMDDAPQEAKESFARWSKQMTQACERNIAYDWKGDFAPQILARGKKYFEEGNLRRIRRCGDTYIADVEGGNVYRVEIDVADGEVVHMGCDCPYTVEWGENCKHMAAVLYALEAGHPVTVETVPVRKRPVIVEHRAIELPWLEAIDHLPEAVVRRKLMQLADRDDGLKERLTVLYLGGLPEGQLTNWKADLQGLAFGACDRHGKMRYEQAEDFFFDLKMFLSGKLPMLLEAKAYLDAVKTVWIVLETAMGQMFDEPDGSLWELKGKCEEYWKKIFDAANEQVRQEMLDWFWSVRNDIDQSYGVDGIEVDYFFLTLPWNAQQHKVNMERLAQEIENTEDDGSKHTELRCIRDRIVELLKC